MKSSNFFGSILAGILIFFAIPLCYPASYLQTSETQKMLTPDKVIEMLKDGNQRFTGNKRREYDYLHDAKVTSEQGQFPKAFVLNCVDSRSDSNLVFDQGIGDIFTGSVAGNVVDDYMLASMEFATKAAGSVLIVVMGHTHCGAVHAACTGQGFGHIDDLIKAIQPAVTIVKSTDKSGQCDSPDFVNKIAKQNVLDVLKQIPQQSDVIRQLVSSGKLKVVGAMHDIATGKVSFFDGSDKAI